MYRSKINRLLESAGIELRLAEDGEDIGRLVLTLPHSKTNQYGLETELVVLP